MRIAVIWFPGNNCERESARAIESAGMKAEIIRWNDASDLDKFDGYLIPGGWSYEDRIRAGVIAAKDPVIKIIKEEAKKGKPVLGICNGAQVLVESGLIPGMKDEVEAALAPNINPKIRGYYCTWVRIKNNGKSNAFTNLLKKDEILRIPIAHAEGRFTTKNEKLIQKLADNGQVVFQYCDKNGKITDKFPINPNGAVNNIAAISNPQGNVMSIMPHPERSNWLRQMPGFHGSFEKAEQPGPGRKIFESMKRYIEKNV